MGGTEEQHGIGPLISHIETSRLREGRAATEARLLDRESQILCAPMEPSTQLKIALL